MSVSVPGGAFSNGATPAALLVRMRVFIGAPSLLDPYIAADGPAERLKRL
jgi:hypothetical protein